ncbi:MAG: nuclear transport factor 2 family protein [Ferruginibacter sp.]
MKNYIVALAVSFSLIGLSAQSQDVESEIRNLEQREVQAILTKDSVALLKLWDKNYTVNSPDNVIVFAGKTTLDRPVLKRARTAFTREIELVTIKGNFAFSMGSETVIPVDDKQQPGQVVKRRFTNIWEKQADGWKLVGRHANIICNLK